MIGTNEQIGTSLRSGIRAVRGEWCLFCKEPRLPERPVHLIRRDMDETDVISVFSTVLIIRIPFPMPHGRVEQHLCTQDIRREEQLRLKDTSVDVRFRRKMHDFVNLKEREQFINRRTVTDVYFPKHVERVVLERLDVL